MTITAREKFMNDFGLKVPIVQGPMGGITGAELVAAVANAGALGILPIWMMSVKSALSVIGKTQQLTSKSFAVNIRADLHQVDHIEAAIDAGVDIVHFFWGDPTGSIAAANTNKVRFIATVDNIDCAKQALAAGVTLLIAQGIEAGGHVLSETPVAELLSPVLSIAGEVPVIAAGGCANGSDAKKLINQGAGGVLFGTRFAVSEESEAHPIYKKALMSADKDATVRSLCFDGGWPNAPHRTLINSTYTQWDKLGRLSEGSRPGEGEVVMQTSSGQALPRYYVSTPSKDMTGDILASAMYAGTGVAAINDCPHAANLVRRISGEMK